LSAILQEKAEIKRLLEIIDNAKDPALLYKALVELGDLYMNKTEYEKAIGCYRQADETVEINKGAGLPGLSFKIQMAEKENRVKKGEIWVCMECSFDNPGSITICKNCGNARDLRKSMKSELLTQKREIKKEALNIIFPVAVVIAGLNLLYLLFHLFAFLYSRTARWFSIPFILILTALAAFFFLKLIVFVKILIIPKLLK